MSGRGHSHSSDRLAGGGYNAYIQGGWGQIAGHPHSCHLVVHGLEVLQQHSRFGSDVLSKTVPQMLSQLLLPWQLSLVLKLGIVVQIALHIVPGLLLKAL